MISLNVTDVLHANALLGLASTGSDIERATIAPANVWTLSSHQPIVYFITNGDRVKIGVSTNVTARVSALALRKSNAVLLLRGSYDLETALHDHFASDRIGKTEWFVYSTRIREYIARRRQADAACRQPPIPVDKPDETSAVERPAKPPTAQEKILAVLENCAPVYVDKDTLRAQTGLTEGSTLDNTLTKMTKAGKIHRGPERGTYALGPGPDAE
jgi:hypothetical protein